MEIKRGFYMPVWEEKFEEKRGRIKSNRAFQIAANNVMSEGYGSIPKRVMRDKHRGEGYVCISVFLFWWG
jgi:hypothetical protein